MTSSQRRSRMEREAKTSYAYKAGQAALRAGAARHGTVNLTPSIADREDWGHAWNQFMAGWRAEQRRTENPLPIGRWFKGKIKRLRNGKYQVRI